MLHGLRLILTVRAWSRPARLLIAGSALLLLASEARATERAAPPATRRAQKVGVALIDLKYVIERHPGFERGKRELEIDAKLAEAMLVLRKESIDKLAKDLATPPASREDKLRLEQVLAQETMDLKRQFEERRSDLTRGEADLYRRAYQQVQEQLDRYMTEHGISVVLQFSRGAGEEAADPAGVAKMLNRPVVAYRQTADISDEIVRRLQTAPDLQLARRPAASSKAP
jgi:Skp family chaperone for outer membrane proteins